MKEMEKQKRIWKELTTSEPGKPFDWGTNGCIRPEKSSGWLIHAHDGIPCVLCRTGGKSAIALLSALSWRRHLARRFWNHTWNFFLINRTTNQLTGLLIYLFIFCFFFNSLISNSATPVSCLILISQCFIFLLMLKLRSSFDSSSRVIINQVPHVRLFSA